MFTGRAVSGGKHERTFKSGVNTVGMETGTDMVCV